MIELNDEIRQAVYEQQGEPLEVVDSAVAAALMNEIMAEDDKDDPYLV